MSSPTALAGDGFPVLRLDADAAGLDARARDPRALPRGCRAACSSEPRWSPRATTSPTSGSGVVIDADQTLRFPDFRAEERTFALVTQLAGRTGRGSAGRVLVQTMEPAARPIVLAAQHDSETFLRGELRRRKALAYPPFTTLIRVVCAAVDAGAAHAAASALHDRISAAGAGLMGGEFSVLGPASLFMLRRRARSQLVVKASNRAAAIAAVGDAVDAVSADRAHREVALSVDVDPQ